MRAVLRCRVSLLRVTNPVRAKTGGRFRPPFYLGKFEMGIKQYAAFGFALILLLGAWKYIIESAGGDE